MEIRPIDVHDDDEFYAGYRVVEASQRFERPFATLGSGPEAALSCRAQDSSKRFEFFNAVEDDETVGAAMIVFPLLDNLDKVYAGIDVGPAMRGQGIGTALVDHLVDRTQDEGRSMLIVASHYPADAGDDHPYRRFAKNCGFELGNAELHRVLDLPVADEDIARWIDESAPSHEGYRIETYVDDLPENLLPSYVQILNQLAVDAPTGDIEFEEEGITVEVYKQQRARGKAQGRTTYITVAVATGPSGVEQAVAHSVIAVPPEGSDVPNAYQFATLVRREHRGHRLGMATKARNLRTVQKAHPGRTMLHTSNSEVNGPMVAINEQFGFRPVEVNAEFVRRL